MSFVTFSGDLMKMDGLGKKKKTAPQLQHGLYRSRLTSVDTVAMAMLPLEFCHSRVWRGQNETRRRVWRARHRAEYGEVEKEGKWRRKKDRRSGFSPENATRKENKHSNSMKLKVPLGAGGGGGSSEEPSSSSIGNRLGSPYSPSTSFPAAIGSG